MVESVSFQVTFDSKDPAALAEFWIEALGYKLQAPPDGFESWDHWATAMGIPEENWNDARALVDPSGDGPRIFIQRVPEPKIAKNRMHLDLNVGGGRATEPRERRRRVTSEARRLESLGAVMMREVEQRGEHWIVMQDPEGNEFCLQ